MTNNKEAMEVFADRNDIDNNREYPEQIEIDQNEVKDRELDEDEDEFEDDDHAISEFDETVNDDIDISDLETIGGNGYGTESTQLSAVDNNIDININGISDNRMINVDNSMRSAPPLFSQRSRSMVNSPRAPQHRSSFTPDPMPEWMQNERNNSYIPAYNL